MKSLHFTNAWHPKSGGIRTFYTALLDVANAHHHEMRLVVPADSDRVEQVGNYGRIYHVKAPPAPFSPSYRILYPQRYFPGGALHRILREERPDLVEVCDKYTLLYLGGLLRICSLPGIDFRPAVVALSCERLDDNFHAYAFGGPLAKLFSEIYLRWLYFPLADHHVAVSKYVASELEAVSGGHKVQRGVWAGPMGVDFPTFSEAKPDPSVRRALEDLVGAWPDSHLLVYAGRLAPEKNLPLLIETVSLLANDADHDYRLVLVGDGDYRQKLKELAEAKAPGRVGFAGHVGAPSALARILASSDLFLHGNPREPFGIGPLEAMATGTPVLVPSSGGVLSYANPENSYQAAPTPQSFAEAVRFAFSDPAERFRRAEAGRRTASLMDWPNSAAYFFRLYHALHARVMGAVTHDDPRPLFLSTSYRI